jgi:hypothetical protein
MSVLRDFRRAIDLESAKQDKVEFSITGGLVSRSRAIHFFRHLRTPDDVLADEETPSLFGRPHLSAEPWKRVPIKSTNTRGRGSRVGPLISGHLAGTARPNSVSDGGDEAIKFAIYLKANPTRFAAYQRYSILPDSSGRFALLRDRFFCRPRHQATEDEHPLELGLIDNVIVGQNAEKVTGATWPLVVDRYFSSILAHVREAIDRAGARYQSEVLWQPIIRLKRVESYWEFPSIDPLAEMTTLSDLAGRTVKALRGDIFELEGRGTELNGDATSLTIKLANKRLLRIYAKTNRRIRVEVVHNFPEARQSIVGPNRHTLDSLPVALRQLAVDASTACHIVLAEMQKLSRRTSAGFPWYAIPRMIEELQGIGISRAVRQSVLSALVNIGSVSADRQGPKLTAIKHLMKLGLLCRPVKREPRFGVTGPYRNALADLRRANTKILK